MFLRLLVPQAPVIVASPANSIKQFSPRQSKPPVPLPAPPPMRLLWFTLLLTLLASARGMSVGFVFLCARSAISHRGNLLCQMPRSISRDIGGRGNQCVVVDN